MTPEELFQEGVYVSFSSPGNSFYEDSNILPSKCLLGELRLCKRCMMNILTKQVMI